MVSITIDVIHCVKAVISFMLNLTQLRHTVTDSVNYWKQDVPSYFIVKLQVNGMQKVYDKIYRQLIEQFERISARS